MKHEHMIYFRVQQVWALFKLCIAYLLSLFYKQKRIWLISERGVDARDNGYWLFTFLRENYPGIEVCYIISRDSPDYVKLQSYKANLLPYRSLAHYIMLWRASVLISTHIQGYFPFMGMGLWFRKISGCYNSKCHVSLKHGITKDYTAYLDYSNTHLDLLISGAKPEYDYFLSAYKYPSSVVQLTGFCRFDGLVNTANHRQILLMPTWREWLYKDADFAESEYAQTYLSLLHNARLHKLLEQYGMDLIFYPHHEVQKYLTHFKQHYGSNHIIIADKEHYDVQNLLRESDVLITDYSSVYFDFAYMGKPVIYYLFDFERYRREHYSDGWYDYSNGLGTITKTENDCIEAIAQVLQKNCEMPEKCRQYVSHLFPYTDQHNCERVYKAICETEKNHNRTEKCYKDYIK